MIDWSKSTSKVFFRQVTKCQIRYLIGIVSILLAAAANATESIKSQSLNPKAPKETTHFGRLVGNWLIKDQSIDKKGAWQQGSGANWNFYWILGGSAIQDDWISPSMDKPTPKGGRQYGTNIRIYNPKSKLWEMAWTSNTGQKVDTFEAVGSDSSIVMNGDYNGAPTRITFFDISEKRFSWKMDKQDKQSKQWSTIYKIEAYKIPD